MLNLSFIYFGQKHKQFDYRDFDIIKKVSRLARKHQAQAVNECNGVGYVKGQCYYMGNIDDWAKREYGYNVKDAYLDKDFETNVFDKESERIQDKINSIIKNSKFKVEYQGDPRGNTVKLYYEGDYIEL